MTLVFFAGLDVPPADVAAAPARMTLDNMRNGATSLCTAFDIGRGALVSRA